MKLSLKYHIGAPAQAKKIQHSLQNYHSINQPQLEQYILTQK